VANERLRNSISAALLTLEDVATKVDVDPKTVERWVRTGRVPHPRHRRATAALLRTTETLLWPELLDDARRAPAAAAELVALYPHRGAVPPELWVGLMEGAREHVDVLVYAGLFLWDGNPDLPQVIALKGYSGTSVRLALGDPGSGVVRERGDEEGIGDGMAARVQMSLAYLRPALQSPGVELRLHSTVLYNSIYRFDNDMLVNCHAYGAPASQSPVLHYRRFDGGRLFNHYLASFDRVWSSAATADHAPPEDIAWGASTT
jgi:hypothetical protein